MNSIYSTVEISTSKFSSFTLESVLIDVSNSNLVMSDIAFESISGNGVMIRLIESDMNSEGIIIDLVANKNVEKTV